MCITNINRRGPDNHNNLSKQMGNWNLYLTSSVLWLQGEQLSDQPIETDSSIFLYNGDIFGKTTIKKLNQKINCWFFR